MKQLILAALLAISFQAVKADTPGKATNHANKITLQNVAALKDYTLYWHKEYGDTTIIISSDTSLVIPGSGGKPDGAEFWGVHKTTKRSTDTLQFSNYYAPDYVVILSGIQRDRFQYTQEQLSNENTIVKTENKDNIANKDLILDAEKIQNNHQLKNILLGAAAGVALGGLTWFVINRRKKKQQNQSKQQNV